MKLISGKKLIFHSLHFEIRTLRQFGFSLLFLLWPGISFIEAIVYWRIRKRNLCRQDSWAHRGQLFLTWVFIIIAHIFFVRVLRKHFSKEAPVEEMVLGPVNILDDVES